MNDNNKKYFLQLPDNDPIGDIREAIVQTQHKFGLDNPEFTNTIVDALPNYFRFVFVCELQLGGQ